MKVLGIALLLCSVAVGQNWDVSPVLVSNGSYMPTSLSVDSSCRPHLAFGLSSTHSLHYAVNTGDSWCIELVDSGPVAQEVDLALDSEGFPHIAYLASLYPEPLQLRYARLGADGWHIDTVMQGTPGSRLLQAELAIDRNLVPHIAFIDTPAIRHARKSGGTWVIQTVAASQPDTLRRLSGISLALDTTGRPTVAVSWYKYGGHGRDDSLWLTVSESDDRGWQQFNVDSAAGWGPWDFWAPCIQNDPASNLFHVVYRAGAYATGRGRNWQVEQTHARTGNVWSDFAFTKGRPHIASSSPMDPLEYEWRWSGGWESELVANEVAFNPTIAADVTGRPHIVYQDAIDTLKYARRLFVGTEEPDLPGNDQPLPLPTVMRAADLAQVEGRLLDVQGRDVTDERRGLNPGVYFLRTEWPSGEPSVGARENAEQVTQRSNVRKVVLIP